MDTDPHVSKNRLGQSNQSFISKRTPANETRVCTICYCVPHYVIRNHTFTRWIHAFGRGHRDACLYPAFGA
uniref:Uncharacterized protein n=1 Tax=Magallana gigas TaxID=29159 RepID=K1PL67_MAGGI